ncbi:MAG: RNA methyltransferase [Acidobacteria bacterium]|nr:RNA methyltransferase [Acidobacteriota bacterium]
MREPTFTSARAISSRQNPLVKRFHAAARHRASGDPAIVLVGARLVADAEAASVEISHVVFSPDALDAEARRTIERVERAGAFVASATDSVMAAVSPTRSTSGVVALAKRPVYDLATTLRRVPQLVLLVVGAQDPGNVGALVRSAEAAHASGVIVSAASADPFGWKAIRGSMGSVFRLPTVIAEEPVDVVRMARQQHLRILAAAPRHGQPIFDANLLSPLLIVLGGEGPGLTPELIGMADEAVTIPMRGGVESLNVGVAGALLLYEAFRQRRANAVRVDRIGGL